MSDTAITKNVPCTRSPRVGLNAGKPCLRPEGEGHSGACVHNQQQLEATISREQASRPIPMTDEEIIRAYTEAEIRERSQALDEAQTVWEQVRHQAVPKMICPQCSGNGRVTGGSLGEFCDRCNGSRIVEDLTKPFDFAMPDFASLRGPITAYGDAHALRAHGVKAALPDKSSVPDLAELRALTTAARNRALELGPGQMPPLPRSLPSAHRDEEGGIDDTATDAELVELEDERNRGGES